MEFWNARPWELTLTDDRVPLVFPEPSLIRELVDLYFRTYNNYFTLLHRPTIERGIANCMHERHYGFGSLLLMICAVTARLTDDPRVYADKRPGAENSAGWQWYSQIRFIRRTYPVGPDLYELQAAALGVVYAHGISSCDDTSYIHAAAIRLAQEIGAHKRRCTSDRIQDELYKRLYWVLVVQDIHVVSVMGRPRATGDEDINLEPLLEVDDEYWATGFTQPPGKIAGPVYMNAFIRGVHILGVLNRTIYACRRPKMPAGMSVEAWEARVVGCIDTVLNKWLCTLPAHLRWDPAQPNEVYRDQAASLLALMCYIQIQAHRTGISSPDASRALAALSTCAQFARNCLRVLDVHGRAGFIPWIHVQQAVFCSTAALMLYVWRTRDRGRECEADVEDVYKGIRLLQLYAKRWQPAGRHLDVIYNLFPRNGFHFDGSAPFARVEKRKQSAPDESVASSSVSSSIATPLSNPEMPQAHALLPDEHVNPAAAAYAYVPPDSGLAHTQEEQHRLDELFQQHTWPTLPNKQDLLYLADNTHTQVERPLFDFGLYDGSPEWGTVGMAGETIFASGASGLPFQTGSRPVNTDQLPPPHHRAYYPYPPQDMVHPDALPHTGPNVGTHFATEAQWYRSTYI
ncbi:fungal-specific transcription factor domain-containing protein [Schizophyllum fasciatum]